MNFFHVYFYTQVLLSNFAAAKDWESFKKIYGKEFSNRQEEHNRRNIFLKKIKIIEDHNEKYRRGLETYEIGVNKFSDFTEAELESYTPSLNLSTESEPLFRLSRNSLSNMTLPAYFDWRDKKIVTPVKNQEECAACWAFAATGALESHHKIHYGFEITLSEQQLIDCVPQADGCGGGWMSDAYSYIAKSGGINKNRDYPFKRHRSSCQYVNEKKSRLKIRGFASLAEQDEELLKSVVVTKGPVSVAIDGGGQFADYVGGVYYNPLCSERIFSHAVVIVGYGSENGQDYWMVKNSWGPEWGLDGYIKMARNKNNHCGIASKASYPVF